MLFILNNFFKVKTWNTIFACYVQNYYVLELREDFWLFGSCGKGHSTYLTCKEKKLFKARVQLQKFRDFFFFLSLSFLLLYYFLNNFFLLFFSLLASVSHKWHWWGKRCDTASILLPALQSRPTRPHFFYLVDYVTRRSEKNWDFKNKFLESQLWKMKIKGQWWLLTPMVLERNELDMSYIGFLI